MASGALRPMVDAFLRPNDLIMCMWRKGDVTFHRVVTRETTPFRPWFAINSAGTKQSVSADDSLDSLELTDPRNTSDKLLYLSNQTDALLTDLNDNPLAWLLHGSFGISPMGRWLRAYVQYPNNGHYFGGLPTITGVQPLSSMNYFGMDGTVSPYHVPTTYRELWIPPQLSVAVAFYNDHKTEVVYPALNLMFETVWMESLNPTGEQYERELCQKMAQGKVAFDTAPLGTRQHMTAFSYTDWKYGDGSTVKPVSKYAVARGEI